MLRAVPILLGVFCCCFAFAAEFVSNPNDARAWEFQVQTPADGSLRTDGGALRIDIRKADPTPGRAWCVQIYRSGKTLIQGRTYVVRFGARATTDREIIVCGQMQDQPWTPLSEYRPISIGRDWKQYEVEIPALQVKPGRMRFPEIQVGQQTGTVWLRDISVREAGDSAPADSQAPAAQPSAPPNQGASVEHMMATAEPANWVLEEHASAKAQKKAEDGSLRIDITGASTERWHVQAYQQNKDLVEGGNYVLKFIAKASSPRKVALAIQQERSPYKALSQEEVVEFATQWQLYTMEFKPTGVIPEHTRMPVFGLGGEAGTVWVRDVSVVGPTAGQ